MTRGSERRRRAGNGAGDGVTAHDGTDLSRAAAGPLTPDVHVDGLVPEREGHLSSCAHAA